MGKLIRLDTSFTGNNLPKLVDYDFTALEAEILATTTLRAFYDAGSASYMTTSGSVCTQLTNRVSSSYHFVQASTGIAPALSTINGVPAIYFDGTKEMKATGLFSGGAKQSVVAFLHPSGAGGSSAIFLSDAATSGQNFYIGNNQLRALNAGVQMNVSNVANKLINYICGHDQPQNKATIYGDGKSLVGTMSGSAALTGDVNLGRWDDVNTGNKYIGHIGHVMIFEEDLSNNAYLRSVLDEYARRKYRTPTWPV